MNDAVSRWGCGDEAGIMRASMIRSRRKFEFVTMGGSVVVGRVETTAASFCPTTGAVAGEEGAVVACCVAGGGFAQPTLAPSVHMNSTTRRQPLARITSPHKSPHDNRVILPPEAEAVG
jgi:hypothetical protein